MCGRLCSNPAVHGYVRFTQADHRGKTAGREIMVIPWVGEGVLPDEPVDYRLLRGNTR